MTHVILLEDQPILREEVADFLRGQGHLVTTCSTVGEFLRTFKPGEHQVAVIDLGLPDGDGLDLIARMRRNGSRMGIVVLTARGSTPERVAGLSGGADHYLSKTSELSELAATIEALARRLDLQDRPRWLLQTSPPQLVPPGQEPIPLSAQDFVVLKTLAQGGECVTREAIVSALGGDYYAYDQRRLDTQMRRLRRKVEDASGLELPVSTIRSQGFRFHAPIDVRL